MICPLTVCIKGNDLLHDLLYNPVFCLLNYDNLLHDLRKIALWSKSALWRMLLISFKGFSGFIVYYEEYNVCFVSKVTINSKWRQQFFFNQDGSAVVFYAVVSGSLQNMLSRAMKTTHNKYLLNCERYLAY